MTTKLATPRDLLTLGRAELGTSSWVQITQKQVNEFADATGDRQWIHIDAERAASGPFGGTIVHGYLTLALAPVFLDEVLEIENYDAVLNYGVNKVRFPAPLHVGAKVRAHITLLSAKLRDKGTVEAAYGIKYETEGKDRPPCAAETVYLYQ